MFARRLFRRGTRRSTRRHRSCPAGPVEVLEERRVLTQFIFTGTDAGVVATVKSFADYDRDGTYETLVSEIQPFGKYRGGVRVATGDFDGDGNTEVVFGLGAKGRSRVDIYDVNGDGSFGARREAFKPFGSSHDAGVNVAAGDLNGDGRDELIVASDQSDTIVSKVRVYSDLDRDSIVHDDLMEQFAPFGGKFTGGVSVAVGDFDQEPLREEVAFGHGPGGSSLVRIYEDLDGDRRVRDDPRLEQFKAFPGSYIGGVNLAAGAIAAAGTPSADLIVGMATRGADVVVRTDLDGDGLMGDDSAFETFRGFPNDVNGGVRVAAKTNRTGIGGFSDVMVAPGRGNVSNVRIFADDSDPGTMLSDNPTVDRFKAFTQEVGLYKRGVFIATGQVRRETHVGLVHPTAIPDHGVFFDRPLVLSTYVAPQAGRLRGLEVTLLIEHTNNEDLEIDLRHVPSGRTTSLFDDVGHDDDGFFVRIRDRGRTFDQLTDDPNDRAVTGDFFPESGTLRQAFHGTDASGVWELTIIDDRFDHTGRILGWYLHFLYE